MSSVGEKLLDEIERVAALRGRYELLRGHAYVDAERPIAAMTQAIAAAKRAVMGDDPIFAISCLKAMENIIE